MRVGCVLLVLSALALGGCKKDEAPASAAPKSQPAQAPAPGAPAASATPTPEPAAVAAPTVGSTKEDGKPADDRDKAGLDQEPATLAEAERAFDKAQAALSLLAGAKTGKGGAATPLAAGDSRCPEACKAMSSLKRAAAAVCRLAGESHERCARAKTIVKDSETRVSVCKCESKD